MLLTHTLTLILIIPLAVLVDRIGWSIMDLLGHHLLLPTIILTLLQTGDTLILHPTSIITLHRIVPTHLMDLLLLLLPILLRPQLHHHLTTLR